MYMKNVMYKIIVGCYIVAALVLVTACNDSLDIQQAYPFTVETLPVPKKLKVGEFLPNDLYPLEKETFRLYYTSASTDQQTIDIYIIDSFGQMQQVSFSFNNDSSEEETE